MTSPADGLVVECRAATVHKGGRAVVRSLDWRVSAEERWVVLGPNGAGKTSLLDVVSARSHPTSGVVSLLGQRLGEVDVFELRPRIGVVSPVVTAAIASGELVRDAVLTAAWGMTGRWREQYEDSDVARAEQLLHDFGVDSLAQRPFGSLSEGERKRVQIARALMPDPELLVLDEPAAGLDLGGREHLVGLLSLLAEDPGAPAIIVVTHHVEEIPPGFTHALLLADGEAVASGPIPEVIRGTLLSQAFATPITVGRFAHRYFAVAAAR
jgi:iron complex transport system ATP-binding protein